MYELIIKKQYINIREIVCTTELKFLLAKRNELEKHYPHFFSTVLQICAALIANSIISLK